MNFNLNKAINILLGKLEHWVEIGIAMLPNAFVAVFVMVASYFAAKVVKLVAQRIVTRFSDKVAINNLLATLMYLFTIGTGVIMALNVLHLEQTVTSLLAGAGIITLALGFAFQDITANFISGILIAFRKPIQVGDIIQTDDFIGEVEKIDLRITMIHTFQGLHVMIPNKDVFQSAITNYTKTSNRRIDLAVGVSYADDLEKVKEVALAAVKDLPHRIPDTAPQLFYDEFGDSSINFTLMIWVHYRSEIEYLEAKSECIIAIKKAFDLHGITIPFPIRTLDFGIKGGERLADTPLTVKTDAGTKKKLAVK